MLGRVLNYKGELLDNLGPIKNQVEERDLYTSAINPLDRPMIDEQLPLGIKAVDGFLIRW